MKRFSKFTVLLTTVLLTTLTTRDKDTFLVTGNGKHFPEKYFIVTPAKLMDILEKN